MENLCMFTKFARYKQIIQIMNKKLFLALAMLLFTFSTVSFAQKRSMTFKDFDSWNRITSKSISANGANIALEITPWRGDAKVELYDKSGKLLKSYSPAVSPKFSNNDEFLVFTQKPTLQEVEKLKLAKTKKDKMPKNSIVVHNLKTSKEEIIENIVSFKLSEKAGQWLAYQNTTKGSLTVRSLDAKNSVKFENVVEYNFAENTEKIYFITENQKIKNLVVFDLTTKTENKITEGEINIKNVAFNYDATKIAYVACDSKDKTHNAYSLYLANTNNQAKEIISSKTVGVAKNWVISEYGKIYFSKNSERLFFGTSPALLQKDTTILSENRPLVHVWNWDESKQYPQQDLEKEKDLKVNYLAVYDLNSNKLTQLADQSMPSVRTLLDGDCDFAFGVSNVPYAIEAMWEGSSRYDYYLVDIATAKRTEIKKACWSRLSISPDAKFATWYNKRDSSWYSYSIEDKKEYRLSNPETFLAWDETNDVPDFPYSYGSTGWSKNDEVFYINDKYDIWSFDPRGAKPAVRLTNGRENNVSYSYVNFDREQKHIDTKQTQTLVGFDNTTKSNGFYSFVFDGKTSPKLLLTGEYKFAGLTKAKDANTVIYTRESFMEFGNVWVADTQFKKPLQISDANPQQKDINWGYTELVSWTNLDGVKLEGVIYYPEDFNPNKKYPMIVSFYEKNSETLFGHRTPEPHRSTIDYHFYTSNGYIVFNPDIIYIDGYPGLSAYNCIMPGITSVVSKGFVDVKRIGTQGHSWGGYQVAYLATRTNLFAAIESGAPVVNMYSAYGGIRWGSGRNRSMQYEHQQSRIGGTIWERPLQYLENSPLFHMDKVKTPILIMHNDQDGHVPWYQGIEYFVSLKRLQKPVWMLNYTGEVHWPQRYANKVDFQKRMFGFFEHYLNGKDMPKWMSEGLKATERDYMLKYE